MMAKRRDQKEQYPCDIAECRIPEPWKWPLGASSPKTKQILSLCASSLSSLRDLSLATAILPWESGSNGQDWAFSLPVVLTSPGPTGGNSSLPGRSAVRRKLPWRYPLVWGAALLADSSPGRLSVPERAPWVGSMRPVESGWREIIFIFTKL